MKEAFGGILNIVLIAVFLLIVEGILGFVVSYTKAFSMKNVVISTFEQYDSNGCLSDGNKESSCKNKIKDGAERIGYAPTNIRCSQGYSSVNGLYCYKEFTSKKNSNYKYYRIVTQVDINVPIISNIMGFSFFQVTGDTRDVYPSFNTRSK